MGHAGMLLAIVLATIIAPAPSSAAAAGARCQASFVNRGTGLFSDEVNLLARCRRDHLRRSIADDSGCPTLDQDDQLVSLELAAVAAIGDSCPAAPVVSAGLCAASAAAEAFDVASVVFGISTAPEPNGALRHCRASLGSQAIRLANLKARVLSRCNQGALRGLDGYGPLGAACESPSGTQAAVAEAEARIAARVAGRCGGSDGIIGTPDDLDPQGDLGFGSLCPGAPYCEFAIDTLPDLVACASCVATQEVDQLSRGLAALPLDGAAACSVATAYYFNNLLDDDLSDLAACEDRILDGHGTGPCPDAETSADLGVNASRYVARAGAACGGTVDPTADAAELLAEILSSSLYPTHAEETDNDVKRCRTEIGKSLTQGTGNARRKLRALRTCHLQRLCGQTSAACPDSEAGAVIAKAVATAASSIASHCAGFTPSGLGFGSTCADEGTCGGLPTTTIAELTTCLQCITDAVIDFGVAIAVP